MAVPTERGKGVMRTGWTKPREKSESQAWRAGVWKGEQAPAVRGWVKSVAEEGLQPAEIKKIRSGCVAFFWGVSRRQLFKYSHALQNNTLVSEGLHTRWRTHRIPTIQPRRGAGYPI